MCKAQMATGVGGNVGVRDINWEEGTRAKKKWPSLKARKERRVKHPCVGLQRKLEMVEECCSK